MKRFRGGLVFEAHRLVYHSTPGLRVIKMKKRTNLLGLAEVDFVQRATHASLHLLDHFPDVRHVVLHSSQFENKYFTEMCSGPEAGSYLRLIDFVYHSTLGLRVIKKTRRLTTWSGRGYMGRYISAVTFRPVHFRKLHLGVTEILILITCRSCPSVPDSSRVRAARVSLTPGGYPLGTPLGIRYPAGVPPSVFGIHGHP